MIIGYGRVSTDVQSLESQLASLRAAGAEKFFAEKMSGARADRRRLAKAIEALQAGDMHGRPIVQETVTDTPD